ncbi:MAG: YwiC-like family protein [Anaerolineae bacterium]|nr:YwiC-like family protein [Anaerolineae bacterium]
MLNQRHHIRRRLYWTYRLQSVGVDWLLVLGAFAAFLLRQPVKIVLKDVRAGRNVPRIFAALRFIMIYGGMTILAGIVMLLAAPSFLWLVPIGFSIPVVAVQFWHDSQNQSRSVIAELAMSLAVVMGLRLCRTDRSSPSALCNRFFHFLTQDLQRIDGRVAIASR